MIYYQRYHSRRELSEYSEIMVGIHYNLKEGGINMTFEKCSNFNESATQRSGCGSCGGCSGDVGATANQITFGGMHSTQRQNKGC